jgi:hypothetical protein
VLRALEPLPPIFRAREPARAALRVLMRSLLPALDAAAAGGSAEAAVCELGGAERALAHAPTHSHPVVVGEALALVGSLGDALVQAAAIGDDDGAIAIASAIVWSKSKCSHFKYYLIHYLLF